MPLGWRFYAQRALSGEWLHTDLPLSGVALSWDRSGPGALTGQTTQTVAEASADDGERLFNEWGTLLFAERDDVLRWGGILIRTAPDDGGRRSVEAAGFTAYPHKVPYEDIYRRWHPDVFDVVRELWSYTQTQPDGNLGVVVDGHNAGVGVGDKQPPPRPERPTRRANETRDHFVQRRDDWRDEADKWDQQYGDREQYRLVPWEAPICGDEQDQLADETPFDYFEQHEWTDRDSLQRRCRLRLGYPSLGRRRHDIRLAEGENLALPAEPERDGDAFANRSIVLGAGEGRKMRIATAGARDGRLRCTTVATAKDVANRKRLHNIARRQWRAGRVVQTLDTVAAWERPGFAPLATVIPGDEVHVVARRAGVDVSGWYVVDSIDLDTTTNVYTFTFGD